MKKTTFTLLILILAFFCQAQWEPNEIDRLRASIYVLDMTPDGMILEQNFFKKIERNLQEMNYPKRGCIWKSAGEGNTSICCCTKTESIFFEIPASGFNYGMYTAKSTIGPWFDPENGSGASIDDFRNGSFQIMEHIVNKIFEKDLSLVEIERIEIEPCLHPQAPDIPLTLCNIKVWYKKCVQYDNCQYMAY